MMRRGRVLRSPRAANALSIACVVSDDDIERTVLHLPSRCIGACTRWLRVRDTQHSECTMIGTGWRWQGRARRLYVLRHCIIDKATSVIPSHTRALVNSGLEHVPNLVPKLDVRRC